MSQFTRRMFLTNMGVAALVMQSRSMAAGNESSTADSSDRLQLAFRKPGDGEKAWAYWWWLEGNTTRTGITADLEAMRQQGIAGVIVFDCGIAPTAPQGPAFMSPEWRSNFQHAIREAARLGLQVSVNLCSGWNAGGPWVTRDDAIKHLVWQETVIQGPAAHDGELPRHVEKPPEQATESMDSTEEHGSAGADETTPWYRDIAVIACREDSQGVWSLKNIIDISSHLRGDRLRWKVPKGVWTVLRIGFMVPQFDVANGDDSVRTKARSITNPRSWEIDPMSSEAMNRHFAATAAKLVQDVGVLLGNTFKYVHIDSWEMGLPTWTHRFLEEFRQRRRYDPIQYLGALAGKTIESAEVSARFVWDYRRTIADLVRDNYYGQLARLAHANGLGTHPESGGPWYTQYIDALECLATNDIPMAEFWSSAGSFRGIERKPSIYGLPSGFLKPAESRLPQANFGSIKQAASAAHVYQKPLCQAEAFTTFNPDWTDDPNELKPFGDRAFCLGLTRNVLNFYVSQPNLTDKPGYQWEHIGPHFDRNVTWWSRSGPWFDYQARCQLLLRQGSFCADLLYFTGEHIPNFPLLDRKPVVGYDFDVINAEALLTRASVQDGRIALPGGLLYRYLVIAPGSAQAASPAVVSKFKDLVEAGATLLGQPPTTSLGLTGYPGSQTELQQLVDDLWGSQTSAAGEKTIGAGRVIWGRSIEELLRSDAVLPDLEMPGLSNGTEIEWIHRRDLLTDIYFVANLSDQEAAVDAIFRVCGRQPQLWDPVTGSVRSLPGYRQEGERTVVPLHFAARQSWFVVFRGEPRFEKQRSTLNFPALKQLTRIDGPWTVSFDKQWDGPERVVFERLEDWSRRPEPSIRYYSGTASYRKHIELRRVGAGRLYLDLGAVKNLAQVKINGHDAGIVWTAPWRVEISSLIRIGDNLVEIDVVNLWPNRLIGDGELPKEQRRTRTNVRTYDRALPESFSCWWDTECEQRKKSGTPATLLPSGLLGPVTLLQE